MIHQKKQNSIWNQTRIGTWGQKCTGKKLWMKFNLICVLDDSNMDINTEDNLKNCYILNYCQMPSIEF